VQDHLGSIIQFYGDGALSIFGSAIEAVECAIKIQEKLREKPQVPLRIGIHQGDIVYDDEGAYGDAVNLAARIQALSVPGGVLVSDRVYEELVNHPGIQTQSLGSHELKHIKRPIEIHAIKNRGLKVPSAAGVRALTGGTSRSIAVLPFVNMSADQETEYFSDGITEEIINTLSKVEGLKVISRTSVFAFKGLNKDVRTIGAELSVSHVLEGSVRKAGNRVRITAQLIDTRDGFHIWSEVFDRNLSDIFFLQDEISLKIATKLKENFAEVMYGDRPARKSTRNIQAYNYFLKGKFFWHKWTPEDIHKSIEQFERAIELSPDYAEAYAGLANCYSYLGGIGRITPGKAYQKAKAAALKSIEINDMISESHIALVLVRLLHDWDFRGAKESLNQALAINPKSAKVKQAYALYLKVKGKNKAAVRILKEALEKDPLSLSINADLARAYLNEGKALKALDQFNKTLEMDGNFRTALEGKGWAYVELGELDKALEMFELYHKAVGHKLKGITQLAYIYGRLHNVRQARRYLKLMQRRDIEDDDVALAMDYAVVHLGMGNHDKVFEHLNQAYEQRLAGVLFIKTNPIWRAIRSDLRFRELVCKIGLEDQHSLSQDDKPQIVGT
jgi:TolB-like protein/Tfp pilus assembly protein PilF